MTGDAKPAVPKKLKKWREEGQILELQGKKIFVHDQGPKVDDAVFIVHGYPGPGTFKTSSSVSATRRAPSSWTCAVSA